MEPSASPRVLRRSAPSAQENASLSEPTPLEHFSAKPATWLFFRPPRDLDEQEQEELRLIKEASPSVETAYQLVAAFMQMLRERTGQQLDTWLKEVEQSHLPEFEPFVAGVQRDKAAVLAGLTLPWSKSLAGEFYWALSDEREYALLFLAVLLLQGMATRSAAQRVLAGFK